MDVFRTYETKEDRVERYLGITVELDFEMVELILAKNPPLQLGVSNKQVIIKPHYGNQANQTQILIPIALANYPGLGCILYELDNSEEVSRT